MPFPSDPPRKPDTGIPEADELFRNANPNPERLGCPPPEILGELARHERAIDDPWFDHLAQCSPCYEEFRALQAQVEKRTFGRRLWIAAAAIALVTFCAWWLLRWNRTAAPERQETRQDTPEQTVVATLNLRGYSPLRGEETDPAQAPPRIPLGTSQLRILLPIGAEPGQYTVQIRARDEIPLANTTGEASIVDYVTTLLVDLDLSGPAPGRYRLAVRHQDESWRQYAVVIE